MTTKQAFERMMERQCPNPDDEMRERAARFAEFLAGIDGFLVHEEDGKLVFERTTREGE